MSRLEDRLIPSNTQRLTKRIRESHDFHRVVKKNEAMTKRLNEHQEVKGREGIVEREKVRCFILSCFQNVDTNDTANLDYVFFQTKGRGTDTAVEKIEGQTTREMKEKGRLVMKLNGTSLAEKTTEHGKNPEENMKNATMNTKNNITKNQDTKNENTKSGTKETNTKRVKTNNRKAENVRMRNEVQMKFREIQEHLR